MEIVGRVQIQLGQRCQSVLFTLLRSLGEPFESIGNALRDNLTFQETPRYFKLSRSIAVAS